MRIRHTFLAIPALICISYSCHGDEAYRKPPKEVLDVLNAPGMPTVGFSPDRQFLYTYSVERYPSIAELSRPMLRLAGIRLDPQNNGPHQSTCLNFYKIKRLKDNSEIELKLPDHARPGIPIWSPDSKSLVFQVTYPDHIELWNGDPSNGKTKKLRMPPISSVIGTAVEWLSDSKNLLVQVVPSERGKAPVRPAAPTGPDVQESTGRRTTIRTLQDLLTNSFDEKQFDYFAASQLAVVDAKSGKTWKVGKPQIFQSAVPSPDGKYFIVTQIKHPYSFQLAATSFPKLVEVWDRDGNVVYTISKPQVTAEDETPSQNFARPRSYSWKPNEPSSLMFIESAGGSTSGSTGAPATRQGGGDKLMALASPFKEKPVEILSWPRRIGSLIWGEKDGMALISDGAGGRGPGAGGGGAPAGGQGFGGGGRTSLVYLGSTTPAKELWTRNPADRYNDPGTPVTHMLADGRRVVVQHGDDIFLSGIGPSPEGDHPFLDSINLKSGARTHLYKSDEKSYETFVGFLSEDGKYVTRKETESAPPVYQIRSIMGGETTVLMALSDPTPQIRGIKKQLVTYKRSDGVSCSFTLYLPADYKPGTKLPTVIWAYPREFADADAAGAITGSTERFTTITGMSHLFFLLQGYAVLDNASMPIVGPIRTANDNFVDQIVMSAKAAIDKAVEMGVTDRDRVGVGGHSYGAFMTANLLAHSDLFRAGIARSGAYNRTLTPFGFQNERRTFWQAIDLYNKMSPFNYADKIKDPILLIHGEADNNPGTFPIQTERMFAAISGNGGKVRAVMLPEEAHGYTAKESIETVLSEMIDWFDKYVKNAKPRPAATSTSTSSTGSTVGTQNP